MTDTRKSAPPTRAKGVPWDTSKGNPKYSDDDVVTDPVTGCMVRPGCRNKKGYVKRRINKRYVYAHVAAWEAKHGPVPRGFEVDHKCRNRACENDAHLRLATRSQQQGNRGACRSGTSQFKGVSKTPRGVARWRAGIAGRYIGTFDTQEEAARAYDVAALERWGEFALLNFPKAHQPTDDERTAA